MNELEVKKTAITVRDFLSKNKAAISTAMPIGANYERFCRTVINAISTTPALAECEANSLFLACVKAFSVGIEPNGPTQEGYLVPFKVKGVAKAQFMPSYRGLISLARRSGMVSLIYADSIREGDKYRIARGTEPRLEHEPAISGRGKTLAFYAVAKLSDGNVDFEIMSPEDVIEVSERSNAVKAKKAGYISATPWDTDFDEMAKKTVLKRLTKRLPVSVENLAFARAVQADNVAERGDDMAETIDIEGVEIPRRIETDQDPGDLVGEPAKRGRPRAKSDKRMDFPPPAAAPEAPPVSTPVPQEQNAAAASAITPDDPVTSEDKQRITRAMLPPGSPSMETVREHLYGKWGYREGLSDLRQGQIDEVIEWIRNWKPGVSA